MKHQEGFFGKVSKLINILIDNNDSATIKILQSIAKVVGVVTLIFSVLCFFAGVVMFFVYLTSYGILLLILYLIATAAVYISGLLIKYLILGFSVIIENNLKQREDVQK